MISQDGNQLIPTERKTNIWLFGSFPFVTPPPPQLSGLCYPPPPSLVDFVTPPPPQLSGRILFAPPDARAIFLHNDLLCNGTCSVIGGRITY